jgi:hypothetical protein
MNTSKTIDKILIFLEKQVEFLENEAEAEAEPESFSKNKIPKQDCECFEQIYERGVNIGKAKLATEILKIIATSYAQEI